MEDSNNVHHPKVLVLRWDLSFTLIQVYQVSTGSVPQGSSEWHTAQLGQLVAVPSLKVFYGFYAFAIGSPSGDVEARLIHYAWRANASLAQGRVAPNAD